ncbi:STAS domain-containing protein [Varunaivibrio sulfuroxidans]|uniref:SpoIIAA-like anti-anti-sigma regulatory factor n=1 Tax=Varunaivibrio sulfuroxidans TaxID=1773489 RepID=A0A4V2UNA2_9PROT|nr:STAS domain-containing protein [Varunaivibrio sulfuroxidans]TCS61231.1 SpoIIAA-like anti-anti-sigma regulatory factor [Varunaivibrio sulfuroxidans]WES31148.1 STAS domain-containing protein [Varunaivibrio sulfuroxidans]
MKTNVQIETTHERATLVSVKGSLELESALELRETLLQAISSAHLIMVKLARVTEVDGSGIACLLEAYQKAARLNKKFVLVDVSQTVSRYLETAQLGEVLCFAPDVSTAHTL